ncbi:glycosyltransferase family 39 protein [Cellulomonas dongxiuzhuiae]|uniref:glycosyltransferase family 39 protein n=1 Tax=Cellulomonas dongxiuzhuiae TaxID=2819979 RepID=UPI001AAF02D9|nr:glycosyltransferase family 39 protein [Cellulomonas dongxiuzhuiae]MBO3089790.1 glycosyltransferase family 39 protein [Cellulomonas dongxiuzhuiae]
MARAGRRGAARTQDGRATAWAVACAAGVLALVVRWRLLGGAAGLRAYHGYDDGVYFSAAVALVHGRLPYRDFLLLHPPGVALALAPFAALTRWVSDPGALAAARVGFVVVGVLNTVLVVLLARRWGTAAAVAAGGLYALSAAAAQAEHLTLLEPLGTLTLLVAVSLLQRARAPAASRRWWYAGGLVLGLGPTVKIWNAVPVAVVIAWAAWTAGRRPALRVTAGAAASPLLVVLPFLVAAPTATVRMVLLAQLGRPRTAATVLERVEGITGTGTALHDAAPPARAAATGAVCVLLAGAALAAWRRRRARLWVALLVAQVAVVLAAPSYYANYAAYSAAAVALVLAAGVSLVPTGQRVWVAALTTCTLGLATGALRAPPPELRPLAEARELIPATGCVRADSPGALAVLDVLSRDEEQGCATRIDVSGQTYLVGTRDDQGRPVSRRHNARWQHDAVAYLTSGSAAVIVRGKGNGFDDTTMDRLRAGGVLLRLPGVRLLVPTPAPSPAGSP